MAGAQGVAEKQGYMGNLEKKSLTELKDLLSRQEKLLDNKYVSLMASLFAIREGKMRIIQSGQKFKTAQY